MLARTFAILAALCVPSTAQSLLWGLDPVSYPLTASGSQISWALAVGDLNQDGRQDLVVVSSDPSATPHRVYLGQPGGGLSLLPGTPIPSLGGSNTLVGITLGDIDGDGILDLLLQGVALKGQGNGTFASTLPMQPYYGVPRTLADIDGDGVLDVVGGASPTSFWQLEVVYFQRGAGQGGFFVPVSWAVANSGSVYPAVVDDATGDGLQDVLIPIDSGFALVTSQGSLQPTAHVYLRGRGLAVGDVTGDSIPDIFTTSSGFLRGSGNGQFLPTPTNLSGMTPRLIFEANGVASKELVLSASANRIVVAKSTGIGIFDTTCQVTLPDVPSSVLLGDVIGDQRQELLVLAGTAPNWRLYVLKNTAPDCNNNSTDDPIEVANGWVTDCDNNGVPDACQTDCDASGAPDVCQIAAQPTLDLNGNGALDSCEPAGTPYCFGDGTGAGCPCDPGQAGPVGGGCLNSTGDGGRLRAVGNAQVSADSVTMHVSGLAGTANGLLFQGAAQQAGGLGGPFGDGLLCVNGTIARLIVRTATNGEIEYGRAVPSDQPLSALGAVLVGGGTLFYQVWYRDSAPFCTAFTYNLTNGLSVAWVP